MRSVAFRLVIWTSTLLTAGASPEDKPKGDRPALEMSRAVVCKKVVGYEDFVELPDASLTSEDKLNVYFRPLNFRVDPVEKPRPGHRYKALLIEDCRIRRKGEKTALQKKDKLVEFDPTFDEREYKLYMLNNIGLKGLPPGDYELDVVLHDGLEAGATATQTVAFTIIPTPKVEPARNEGAVEPASPPAPAPKSKKTKTSKTSKP